MKVIPVDLDVTSDGNVSGSDELVVLVDILVLSPLQELAFHDARVLLGWLEDLDGIVTEEEADDEASVNIFRGAGVESGCESENLLVVVDVLEEVSLGLVWQQLEYITE